MIKTIIRKWRRRPFPTCLAGLRACRISYSQLAEDLIASALLGYEKNVGVYVDVGCYDPIAYSNTYIFYQRGWRGVCIDPNPEFKDKWHRYRPGDTFVNCGIAKSNGLLFYLKYHKYPACNQLVASAEEKDRIFKASPFDSTLQVQAQPLHSVLDERMTNGVELDLMSVDCEGMDFEVLQSNNWTKYRPKVLIVEERGEGGKASNISSLLTPLNYRCVAQTNLSKVYSTVQHLAKIGWDAEILS